MRDLESTRMLAMRVNRKPDWTKKMPKAVKAVDDDTPPSAITKAALQRLGVTEEQLRAVPAITPVLALAHGGRKQIIAAMRMAQNDAAITAYMRRYDALPKADKSALPVEAVCVSARVDPLRLLGGIMAALQQQSVASVKMIALTAHPQITQARIRYGQMPSGDKDRQALDQAMGFLPNPKGPTFISKAIFGTGANAMQQQRLGDGGPDDEDEEEVPIAADGSYGYDLDKIFPPAVAMQEKLVAIRQRLAVPDPVAEPVKPPDSLSKLFKRDS